jgi:hypothetical protein
MTEPALPGIVYIFTNEAMPGYVKCLPSLP